MAINKAQVRQIFEITWVAGFLFAAPLSYAHYRNDIQNKFNSTYYKYLGETPAEKKQEFLENAEEVKNNDSE